MFNRYETVLIGKFVNEVRELIMEQELHQFNLHEKTEALMKELKGLDLTNEEIKELLAEAFGSLTEEFEGFGEFLGYCKESLMRRDKQVSKELSVLSYFYNVGDITKDHILEVIPFLGEYYEIPASGKQLNKMIDILNLLEQVGTPKEKIYEFVAEDCAEFFESCSTVDELIIVGTEMINTAKVKAVGAATVIFYIQETYEQETVLAVLRGIAANL